MGIRIHKPISSEDIFRGLSKSYSPFQSMSGSDITWYMVSRGDDTWSGSDDDLKNLFMSFGLAREDENDYFRALNGVADYYRAKNMVIAAIDESEVDSYIDGSTLEIRVPTGVTSTDYTTFYGSLFNGSVYNDGTRQFIQSNEFDVGVFGGSYVYLFPNTSGDHAAPANTYPSGWSMPYSGLVDGATNPNSAYTSSWEVSATKNSIPHIRATHWDRATDDGADIPYGIAFLERGLFVFFDMHGRTDFIGNVPAISGTSNSIWTASTLGFDAITNSGGTYEQNTNNNYRQGISFTGSVAYDNAQLTFRTIDQSYKLIYFCHASQNEFNSTTNHTYNHAKGYFRPTEADSLYITEIALYDDDSLTPIAYAKLSEPVEKSRLETLTFKVELEL